MKKAIVASICFLLAFGIVYSYEGDEFGGVAVEKKEQSQPEAFCPKTKISDNNLCLKCHILKPDGFGLIETLIESQYYAKPVFFDVIQEEQGGPPVGFIKITDINDELFKEVAQYLGIHPEIKKLVIELHSPGGSVFDAWRIVGYIDQIRSTGVKISTKCYGFAASAGFILFVAGDIGERYVSPWAELMTHKVWTFSMFKLNDPDNSEDETNLLKHLQANINSFIAARTKLDVNTLEDKTYKKDWWITGKQAVEDYGVADGYIK